jgi:PAS domain S-box-containing protein
MTNDGLMSQKIREDEAIRFILEGTVADIGEQFFQSLVSNLAQVLQTKGAWGTEYKERDRKLKPLAFLLDGCWLNNVAYDISGTACERVIIEKQLVSVSDRLLELYKGNSDLAELEDVLKDNAITSYLGVPLIDADDKILGHMSVIDNRPIPNYPQVVNIFRVFANRASAELQRLRAEKKIHQEEEKFRKLFDSTMDAIIEIDRDFNITRINLSGEKLLKLSSSLANGTPLKKFFALHDFDKISALIKTLDRQPRPLQGLWIPGGLQAMAVDGDQFPAEGTLSKYEYDSGDYFSLILRNEQQKRAAEEKILSMAVEAEYLREEVRSLGNYHDIIGESRPLCEVLQKVKQVSVTDATVLISGETGTGKEAIARAIHNSSKRYKKPLITVNCAAIPGSLIESEFFGHEKGSFTGATTRRHGRFTIADKGTIFLDEIGELPIDMQAKLLRVLQEGEFEPVGSSKSIRVDVRVIAATNRNLLSEIEKGTFREDLYYRLNVFPLKLPPLRDRGDDVVILARYFIEKFSKRMGRPTPTLGKQEEQLLHTYPWPGNVRELQNIIERAVIISAGKSIELTGVIPINERQLPSAGQKTKTRAKKQLLTEKELREIERDSFLSALEVTGWRVSGQKSAARLLGINPSTFVSRMKKLGIDRPQAA